ncbi:MAG: helix-turn-helix domain-containing protein [Gulosibacter sp.]|uniref:helix-turn-helix domain-containing protein n=1 Tax=Gulosibacter sp. TaxID=2817531 RepID=UPI003F91B27E
MARPWGTPVAETAYEYFDLGCSVAKVSTRMLIHENTVRQRLERVAELLGDGWVPGQSGLDHHILLAAHRLIG